MRAIANLDASASGFEDDRAADITAFAYQQAAIRAIANHKRRTHQTRAGADGKPSVKVAPPERQAVRRP